MTDSTQENALAESAPSDEELEYTAAALGGFVNWLVENGWEVVDGPEPKLCPECNEEYPEDCPCE